MQQKLRAKTFVREIVEVEVKATSKLGKNAYLRIIFVQVNPHYYRMRWVLTCNSISLELEQQSLMNMAIYLQACDFRRKKINWSIFKVVFNNIFSSCQLYELSVYIYLSRWFYTIYTAVGANRPVIFKQKNTSSMLLLLLVLHDTFAVHPSHDFC